MTIGWRYLSQRNDFILNTSTYVIHASRAGPAVVKLPTLRAVGYPSPLYVATSASTGDEGESGRVPERQPRNVTQESADELATLSLTPYSVLSIVTRECTVREGNALPPCGD